MRTSKRNSWPLLTLPIVLAASAAPGIAQDTAPAHTHVRHVAETFRGTPDRMGLLPTAITEAEVALQHATLAGRDPTSLDAMQRHAGHVLHALDPDEAEGGPGRGYGLIEAARRTAHYAELAMISDGAGEAITTHGVHVATAARSAASMGERAVEVAEEILEAEDADSAADLLKELTSLCEGIVNGVDADGDGRIGWQEGEGGLTQAAQHLELLRRGEGLVG